MRWSPGPTGLRLPGTALQRRACGAAVVAQVAVAVGGATVRVTGSGLGCPTWPQCTPDSLLPDPSAEASALHQWIEFGNRLLGVGVGLVGAFVLVVALLTRPWRRRFVLLAATMALGVLAQAVIGGLSVLLQLEWWSVTLHFLPSPALVWLAVMLATASGEGDGPVRPSIPQPLRRMVIAMTAALAVLLITGTVVTAAGPHAGDADTARLELPVATLTQVHADVVFLFTGMLVAFGFALRAVRADRRIWRHYLLLVAAILGQAALGTIQYRLGVPALLVALHVLGAMLTVAAMAGLWAADRERGSLLTLGGADGSTAVASGVDVPGTRLSGAASGTWRV